MKQSAQAGEPRVTVVAIDDDPAQLDLIRDSLERSDVDILTSPDPERGLQLVVTRQPEILLLDLMLPGTSGMDLLEHVVEHAPSTEVILLTGHYSTEAAVEAVRKGASDYLNKPVPVALLRERIDRLVQQAKMRGESLRLEDELMHASQFEGLVGRSPEMMEVFSRVRRVAPHFRTVLVTGATGTGKEGIARALHRLSPAAGGTFAVCNCAAIVETLFESELFGYVRGAFTGAMQDKQGLVEYSSGGVLFLDEIGDMPLATQAKILRVLQNQEVQRVGSPLARRVDLRVVAATNRDLRAMVEKKEFREDLYYRLSMVEVRLPRLAERKEDLPLLERHFIERFGALYGKSIRGLTRRAMALLASYSWPGNVRELENAVGHACMMTEGEYVDVSDLPDYLRQAPRRHLNSEGDALLSLEEVQRRHALRVLTQVQGNKARAAEILGISRATLYRLLAEGGAEAPADSRESA